MKTIRRAATLVAGALAVLLATTGALTVAFSLVGNPADAQVVPTLPAAPPLPPEADPALAVLAPTLAPVCGLLGAAQLVQGLVPQQLAAALGPVLPVQVFLLVFGAYDAASGGLSSLVTSACSSLPVPGSFTTCDADQQVASTPPADLPVNPLTLLPPPFATLIDTVAAIERAAPASAPASVSGTVAGPLGCRTVDRVATDAPETEQDVSPTPAAASGNDAGVEETRVLADVVERPTGSPSASGRTASAQIAAAPALQRAAAAPSGNDNVGRNLFRVLMALGAVVAAAGWAYAGRERVDTP